MVATAIYCNGNLLCDHGVVERNRYFNMRSKADMSQLYLFAEPWKGVGKEMLSPVCLP